MIKGVIYDLDDLMVNSDPLQAEAWEMVLKKLGHKFSALPEELRSKFVGMRIIDIAKEIVKEFKLNIDVELFYKERTKVFLKLIDEKVELMPGLLYSLKLFEENDFKLAIASSGTKEYIHLVLTKFNIAKYFDAITSGDDVKFGKPDPEIFVLTTKKLNLRPEECLVLEDATKGIKAAKSAGCKCIAIINHNTPPQNYSGLDIVLSSLEELSWDTVKSL